MLSSQSLTRFAGAPFAQGSLCLCMFFLCAAEKAEAKVKVSKPNTAEKRRSRTLPQSPSATAPSRREPMFVRFFALCHRESKDRTKSSGKTKVAHSPSVAPRQLPLGGSLCLCIFSLCATEKTKGNFRTSKAKICTFFLCGSAVRHYEPSSGRKVSRASVTEGACGTERRHIFLFPHRSRSTDRLPSFKEGSCQPFG